MKSKFKLTALAVALATVTTGSAVAKKYTDLNLTGFGPDLTATYSGNYLYATGSSQSKALNGATISQRESVQGVESNYKKASDTLYTAIDGTEVKDAAGKVIQVRRTGKFTQTSNGTVADSENTNGSSLTDASVQASRFASESKTTTQTGTISRDGATTQLYNPNSLTVISESRVNDTGFDFVADDVTKDVKARKTVSTTKQENIAYKASDDRNNFSTFQSTNDTQYTEQYYDKDGKPVNFNVDATGKIILDANGSPTLSTFHHNESGSSFESTTYKANTPINQNSKSSRYSKQAVKDAVDGFEGYNNSASNFETTTYNAGKHELSSSNSSSNSSDRKSKEYFYDKDGNVIAFNVDAKGNLVATNPQYIQDAITGRGQWVVAPVASKVNEQHSTSSFKNTQYQANQSTQSTSNSENTFTRSTKDVVDGFETSSKSSAKSSDTIYNQLHKDTVLKSSVASETADSTKFRVYQNTSDGKLLIKDGKPVVDNEQTTASTSNRATVLYKDGASDLNVRNGSAVKTDTLNATTSNTKTYVADPSVLKDAYAKSSRVINNTYDQNLGQVVEVSRNLNQSNTTESKDKVTFTSAGSTYEVIAPASVKVAITQNGGATQDLIVRDHKDATGKVLSSYVVWGTDINGEEIRLEVQKQKVSTDATKLSAIELNKTDNTTKEIVNAKDSAVFYDYQATNSREHSLDYNDGLAGTFEKSDSTESKTIYTVGQPIESQSANAQNTDTQWRAVDINGKVTGIDRQITSNSSKETTYQAGQSLDRTVLTDKATTLQTNGSQVVATNWTGGARVDENGRSVTNANSIIAYDEKNQPVYAGGVENQALVNAKTETKTASSIDEKVYQSGDTAYSRVAKATTNDSVTYADGFAGYNDTTADTSVTLYNNGANAKARAYTNTISTNNKTRTYTTGTDGKAVASLDSTLTGKVLTTESNYQVGQALEKEQSVVSTQSGSTTDFVSGSTIDSITDSKSNSLTYSKGQVIATHNTGSSNNKQTTTNSDKSNAVYSSTLSNDALIHQTVTGVLATNDIKSIVKNTDAESVVKTDAKGAAVTYSIAGAEEATDYSNGNSLSKRSNTVSTVSADGSATEVKDSQTDTSIRHGIVGDTERNRATINTSTAGVKTEILETRVDGINGSTLSKKVADGQVATTSVTADGVTTTGVVKSGGGFDASGKLVSNVGAGIADTDAANIVQLKNGDATTLASSKAYTDTSSATTLAAANTYTDSRANQLNHRLDDVEKTAYRGVAIALAAQQAIPNLKPGNFAVYGGIGHYEGENAGALGVATLLGNGRTSINAAFGFASSQVGGRVGVSYVFGD